MIELVIVGDGPIVEVARSIASRTRGMAARVETLTPDRIADTELAFLAVYATGNTEVFAAIGLAALNFARFDLWAKFRFKGFRCATLVDPAAAVDAAAIVADNVLIDANATIGPGATVGSGTIVHAGAHVGAGATVGKFCWLAEGVTVGAGARIGAHVVLGAGVHIAGDADLVGSNEISVPGCYRGTIAFGTFISPEFALPVRHVIGG